MQPVAGGPGRSPVQPHQQPHSHGRPMERRATEPMPPASRTPPPSQSSAIHSGTPVGSGSLQGYPSQPVDSRASLSSSTYVPSSGSSARPARSGDVALPAKPTPSSRLPKGLESMEALSSHIQRALSPRPHQQVAPVTTPSSASRVEGRMDRPPESPRPQRAGSTQPAVSRTSSSRQPDVAQQHHPQQHPAVSSAHRAAVAPDQRRPAAPTASAPDAVDINYLQRNMKHLQGQKHELQKQLKHFQQQLLSAKSERDQWRAAYEQAKRDVTYAHMPELNPGQEVQGLKDQLAAAQMLKEQLFRETEELREQLRTAQSQQGGCKKEESTCVVCMDNLANIVCLPCKHLVLCSDCKDDVETCPICRTDCEAKLQVYTP